MKKRDPARAIRHKNAGILPVQIDYFGGIDLGNLGNHRKRGQGKNTKRNMQQRLERRYMAYEVVRIEPLLQIDHWRRTAKAKEIVAEAYFVNVRTVSTAIVEFRSEAEENIEKYISNLQQHGYL